MEHLKTVVLDSVFSAIKEFSLPKDLGFGAVMAPVMASCTYENGKWGSLEVKPYGPIQMAPSSKVLHYAQEIFEGLKAYRVNGQGPFLFRPEENSLRFNRSAARLAMPSVPRELFLKSVMEVAFFNSEFIPTNSGESLYLRPFLFAADEDLGINPSNRFRYMVIASPGGACFSRDSFSVLIERESARAFPGGTGYAKAGANYAASFRSTHSASKLGCSTTLWLDGLEQKYVEEMSGMNFFAVLNGRLHTPSISDTILDGVTRKSLIVLARDLGIQVVEERIDLNKMLKLIGRGDCTEAFACGTAAIVRSIDELIEKNGEKHVFKRNEPQVATRLHDELLSIQEGRGPDRHRWMMRVQRPSL